MPATRTIHAAAAVELNPGEPLSLAISRGDVLFLPHLLAHAGSCNAGNRPRFGLNMKW